MTAATERIRLTERDQQILDHIHRYRVSTLEVLHRLFWEPSVSLNAVSQRLKRLDGYVHAAPLIGSRNYYLLTPSLARQYGEEDDFAKPLKSSQSLARHIALLEYCCLDDEPREKITSREFKDGFQSFDVSGVGRHSYLHTFDTPAKLAWLEVDARGEARKRAKKCFDKFQLRLEHEPFRKLTERGLFGVVLVTTSERKRQQLERCFARLEPFPLEIVVNTTVRDIVVPDTLQR